MPATDIASNVRVQMRVIAVLCFSLLSLSCVADDEGVDMVRAVMDHSPCTHPIDSPSLARAAIDTMAARYRARGMTLESTVRRFEADSISGMVRVVTMPRPHQPGGDAVGIVLMDCDGRAFDVILTDTANSPDI